MPPAMPRLPAMAQPTHAGPKLSCVVGQAREPIYVVDEQEYIIRTLHR